MYESARKTTVLSLTDLVQGCVVLLKSSFPSILIFKNFYTYIWYSYQSLSSKLINFLFKIFLQLLAFPRLLFFVFSALSSLGFCNIFWFLWSNNFENFFINPFCICCFRRLIGDFDFMCHISQFFFFIFPFSSKLWEPWIVLKWRMLQTNNRKPRDSIISVMKM